MPHQTEPVTIFSVKLLKLFVLLMLVPPPLFADGEPATREPASAEESATAVDSSARWYFGFGPAFFSSLNTGGTGVGIEAARNFPVNAAEIRWAFDFALKGGAFMGSSGIGVNYFFLKDSISPYLGGEFGFGLSRAVADVGVDGSINGGFVAAFSFGVQFFRDSPFHLDVGFKGSYMLRDTLNGYPQVYVLHVGLVI